MSVVNGSTPKFDYVNAGVQVISGQGATRTLSVE